MCDWELHKRLIASQSDEELERKARKACTKHYWQQEELDAADRQAKKLYGWFEENKARGRGKEGDSDARTS